MSDGGVKGKFKEGGLRSPWFGPRCVAAALPLPSMDIETVRQCKMDFGSDFSFFRVRSAGHGAPDAGVSYLESSPAFAVATYSLVSIIAGMALANVTLLLGTIDLSNDIPLAHVARSCNEKAVMGSGVPF